ncbi:hypothetical protein GJ496_000029 [Pomphorhynchus laevis]|nr:hypothetical protein GJ496_000029 [Pomphorhynchus laevis]
MQIFETDLSSAYHVTEKKGLEHLVSLDLYNCEITLMKDYRDILFSLLPKLHVLDGWDNMDKEVDESGEDSIDSEESVDEECSSEEDEGDADSEEAESDGDDLSSVEDDISNGIDASLFDKNDAKNESSIEAKNKGDSRKRQDDDCEETIAMSSIRDRLADLNQRLDLTLSQIQDFDSQTKADKMQFETNLDQAIHTTTELDHVIMQAVEGKLTKANHIIAELRNLLSSIEDENCMLNQCEDTALKSVSAISHN